MASLMLNKNHIMEKKERKKLESKIHAALIQALKDEKNLLTDKIEKAVKKAVKQLSKKLTKKKKVAVKKTTTKKAATKPSGLVYKKIKPSASNSKP